MFEFSAGDFNWVVQDGQAGIICEEIEEMIVAYAPYGSDGEDSMEILDFELNPEASTMPSFGYSYRGSLSGVTQDSPNGWYDLYFLFSDKAGNEMVQQISPAFKIGHDSGVNSSYSDIKARINVMDGIAYVQGIECARVEMYSVDGKLIASSYSAAIPTNGHKGVAIFKVVGKNGYATSIKAVIL